MLFINPPFGNYISLPNTISIKGSYTLNYRPGLISQIFKTLHYNKEYNGWINKIGLRNPGIDYAIKHYKNNHIVSIAIIQATDIDYIENKIPKNMNIELNISCPNVDHTLVSHGLEYFLNDQRKWCIIKLSPIDDMERVDFFYKIGFKQFHCCNTLPVKLGGLSGPTLKKYTLPLIKNIKNKYPDTTIIGGGGIRTMKDIEEYKKAGADHFGVSTICFSPLGLMRLYLNYMTISSSG
jgi:dihydroorotate dehydrogenase